MPSFLRRLGRRAKLWGVLCVVAACAGTVESGQHHGVDGGARDGEAGARTDGGSPIGGGPPTDGGEDAGLTGSPAQDATISEPEDGGSVGSDPDGGPTLPPGIPANANLLPWLPGVSFRVTQGHGMGSHTGAFTFAWDFDLPVGTTVVASHDGVVRFVKSDSRVGGCDPMYFNDGNYVILEKEPGVSSVYGHLDTAGVTVGQRVRRGEVLGTSGETGYVCGAHLHFHFQNDSGVTVEQVFYDTGAELNPPRGAIVTSANVVVP